MRRLDTCERHSSGSATRFFSTALPTSPTATPPRWRAASRRSWTGRTNETQACACRTWQKSRRHTDDCRSPLFPSRRVTLAGARAPAFFLREATARARSGNRCQERVACRLEVTPRRLLDAIGITPVESFDVFEVLAERSGVPFSLVHLVPLIVIVKDERDHVMEVGDEPIPRSIVDEPVKALVEVGKVVVARLDLREQVAMLLLDLAQRNPCRRILRLPSESLGGADLEQLAYFEK